MNASRVNNIVLVNGGFVDGSGWESVYTILKNKGFNVSIVQNPTISLADDVAVTNRVINAQDGPVALVGHTLSPPIHYSSATTAASAAPAASF